MKPTQDVFERYEQKYLLEEAQYASLMQALRPYVCPDEYGNSTVQSIYFDTPDRRLVRTSLEKPVYKEKLRLRSYGTPREGDPVFVELKKKYRGIVYKRRTELFLEEAERALYEGDGLPEGEQIPKEINRFLDFYGTLRPAMALSYERTAYCGREDPALRLTFDKNILWREEALSLRRGAWGEPLLEPGQRLLEVKIPGAMPLWLVHLLDSREIYPSSFSKYGSAYERTIGVSQRKGGLSHAC